jgi:hypothetical protein
VRLNNQRGLWGERVGSGRCWAVLGQNLSLENVEQRTKHREAADALFAEAVNFIRLAGLMWGTVPQHGSAFRFEARLELGIELVKAGLHPTSDVSPTPILERDDGDSQFEFDGILGLKVTTAVAADDF